MNIGEKTFQEVSRQVFGMMSDYEKSLNLAFLKAGDDALSVSFTAKIKPVGNVIDIKTDMAFTMEKIKDSTSGKVAEGPTLFDSSIEHLADRRTRLHVAWMASGGTNNVPFESYLKSRSN